MSEATVRSQVRFGDKTNPVDSDSLVGLPEIKLFFGITDSTYDAPLEVASAIVTSVIRGATGRHLSYGEYIETYADVFEPKTERYLVEIPVELIDTNYDGQLMNHSTGRVLLVAGQVREVHYTGGYAELPAALMGVFMELMRQQMALQGYDQIGTAPAVSVTTERSVTVGTLRVDYATGANSAAVKSSGGGAITADALAPYGPILLQYSARTSLVAT